MLLLSYAPPPSPDPWLLTTPSSQSPLTGACADVDADAITDAEDGTDKNTGADSGTGTVAVAMLFLVLSPMHKGFMGLKVTKKPQNNSTKGAQANIAQKSCLNITLKSAQTNTIDFKKVL